MSNNTEAVKTFFELQYAGKFDEAFKGYANPEFSWAVAMSDNAALTAAIPWAGRRLEGAAGYQELTGQLFGEYESLEFDARRYHDTSDVVFAEGYFKFRHRKTGKIAEAEFCMRFDMRDGRISGGQIYENTYGVAMGRT